MRCLARHTCRVDMRAARAAARCYMRYATARHAAMSRHAMRAWRAAMLFIRSARQRGRGASAPRLLRCYAFDFAMFSVFADTPPPYLPADADFSLRTPLFDDYLFHAA